MTALATVDLAHAPELAIGPLRVRPGLREIVGADGSSEIIEPRVMQVLVALARAEGGIVSRDDLIACCWGGRIVGEDAITRVISRLRRLADGMGAGIFRIETINKVGYRLVLAGAADEAPAPAWAPLTPIDGPGSPRLTRRAAIAGAATLAAGAGVAGGYWWFRPPPGDSTEVQRLIEDARLSLQQLTPEGIEQAIGLMRRAVEIAPDSADAWGLLASAYSKASHGRAAGPADDARIRAEAAIARATALDPGNALAAEARGALLPFRGRWAEVDRVFVPALARHPRSTELLVTYGSRLTQVGRNLEAARLIDQAVARARPAPALLYYQAQTRWRAERLEEADRAIEKAYQLFPLHYAVWFTRFYLLLYTGRAEEALRFLADAERRPTGIPEESFEDLGLVARAVGERTPATLNAARSAMLPLAKRGAGHAENAMQFCAYLGLLDLCFSIAGAYYFGRGFEIDARRFSTLQRFFTRGEDRHTGFLFAPSTAAMRADARFEPLVTELGLDRYWAEAKTVPDYRRRG